MNWSDENCGCVINVFHVYVHHSLYLNLYLKEHPFRTVWRDSKYYESQSDLLSTFIK